jgi:hypothetical protein
MISKASKIAGGPPARPASPGSLHILIYFASFSSFLTHAEALEAARHAAAEQRAA